MKKNLTWTSFVKLVCGIVALLLIGCVIAKIIQPEALKDFKFETLLMALAIAILLPYFSQLEAFGVKVSVREQVDNLSTWVKASPYYTLGSECEVEGDNLLAERYYLKGLEECPTFWPSILGLASIYHEKGEYDRAIVYYQDVLKLNPDNVYTYNNLANIYLNAKPPIYDPKKALGFAEEAIKHLPSLGSAYYYKGWALNDLQNYEAARNTLRGALDSQFALKDDAYWIAYELAVAKSHLTEPVTVADLDKMLRLAEDNHEAGKLVEIFSRVNEQERFSPEVQKTIREFVKKHKE